ncbi:MAG TPA: response regulator transcription factor [Dehalococcoidia bacterium]
MMAVRRGASDILIVDDDAGIRRVVTRALETAGYTARSVPDRASAIEELGERSFALAILDVNLPDANGLDLCAEIHAAYGIPVVMLTVVVDEHDIVRALESGADDYVRKPFSTRELVARVQSVLRRAAPEEPAMQPLEAGPLRLDPDRHRVDVDGQPLTLTRTEFRLLALLVADAGHVLPHDQLLQEVWGVGYEGESHMLHVTISRIRHKLARVTDANLIRTVAGKGYEFIPD